MYRFTISRAAMTKNCKGLALYPDELAVRQRLAQSSLQDTDHSTPQLSLRVASIILNSQYTGHSQPESRSWMVC